ncbi:hypothetical protein [Curtobacterium sp. MCSS17_015]|uniref:hypothetical protein n=1 Tax=Curtobacterium sp. MCSS17_015 TaxID=2175666 RepID=UPI0011B7BB2A|nr:hypothetical protein [Curtobacterium sp. MCSS17_015]WIB25435.1 hypothetical protein DEJ18_10235 [Curtobacterium sp. MCSS17_015]
MQSLAALSPRLMFCPSGSAVSPTAVLASRPVVVTPATNGTFTVELQPTDQLRPEGTYYTLRVEWLDATGGFVAVDLLDWPIFVPSGGGSLADLVDAPAGPALMWTSLEEPPFPKPGMRWLQSNPNDLADPANTGNLYEWSAA